jgi:uncharacterized protein YaiL (DUF2058 family)
MKNSLQDQLLKAGLAKKSQVAQAAREQAKQRQAKTPGAANAAQVEAERARAERVERDRQLAAERAAQLQARESRAQARQLVETHRVAPSGELAYRFTDGAIIRELQVDPLQRRQLASGALVVARSGDAYALLPRAAADKVRARDASLIVTDHGAAPVEPAPASDDDAFYARFEVPDDLIW